MSQFEVRTAQGKPVSLLDFFFIPVRHRHLIFRLIQRDVVGRYRGSFIGIAWSFFTPLIMLVLYTFVFSVIFKARWPGFDSKTGYALIVFSGLIVHGMLAECLNRAPALITANPNYVKKMLFPLDIFAWVTMGSALFHASISWLVLTIAQAALGLTVPWTAILFPVVMMPLMLFCLGAVWFLAALGVYFRDIAQVTGMLSLVLQFLAPIFYSLESLPPRYRWLVELNPLTPVIEQARQVLIYGVLPTASAMVGSCLAALVFAIFGFAWFQKLRIGFADVV